jgi:hypothetical protein
MSRTREILELGGVLKNNCRRFPAKLMKIIEIELKKPIFF